MRSRIVVRGSSNRRRRASEPTAASSTPPRKSCSAATRVHVERRAPCERPGCRRPESNAVSGRALSSQASGSGPAPAGAGGTRDFSHVLSTEYSQNSDQSESNNDVKPNAERVVTRVGRVCLCSEFTHTTYVMVIARVIARHGQHAPVLIRATGAATARATTSPRSRRPP